MHSRKLHRAGNEWSFFARPLEPSRRMKNGTGDHSTEKKKRRRREKEREGEKNGANDTHLRSIREQLFLARGRAGGHGERVKNACLLPLCRRRCTEAAGNLRALMGRKPRQTGYPRALVRRSLSLSSPGGD